MVFWLLAFRAVVKSGGVVQVLLSALICLLYISSAPWIMIMIS